MRLADGQLMSVWARWLRFLRGVLRRAEEETLAGYGLTLTGIAAEYVASVGTYDLELNSWRRAIGHLDVVLCGALLLENPRCLLVELVEVNIRSRVDCRVRCVTLLKIAIGSSSCPCQVDMSGRIIVMLQLTTTVQCNPRLQCRSQALIETLTLTRSASERAGRLLAAHSPFAPY